MTFSSYIFVMLFLPVVIVGNRLLWKWNEGRNAFLIASSILFYACGGISSLIVLIISIIINYGFVYLIEKLRNKAVLIGAIACNIALLLYFKYINFAIENINKIIDTNFVRLDFVIPIGISFFTFQQISFLLYTYKNSNKWSLSDYLLYVQYFPKILMGPLAEPEELIPQFHSTKPFDYDQFVQGVMQFALGLFKKKMIADVLAVSVEWGGENIGVATSLDCVIIMLSFTFQIYFDFSGYTDMAMGISYMMGISLPVNFDSPYRATSIRDFWKRWHMSLTSFFTRYIYIPLGGNRKGIVRTCINTMIVFLVSGIWHGANWTFFMWGALHGGLSLFDRLLDKILVRHTMDFKKKVIQVFRWIFTFAAVNVLWLLFASNSISDWWNVLLKMICFDKSGISQELVELFASAYGNTLTIMWGRVLQKMGAFFGNIKIISGYLNMVGLFTVSFIICMLPKNNCKIVFKKSAFNLILAVFCILISVIFMGAESAFIYLNF